MSYLSIENLYKNQDILLFEECYAMEKIHGTSAHISYHANQSLNFFAGGGKHENFIKLFNEGQLILGFKALGVLDANIVIFGEAYGGKCQAMSDTYGKELKFIAFEVKIGNSWLSVPQAEKIVKDLGLEFVHYVKTPTTIEALDLERDRPSEQAFRNGCADRNDPSTFKKREGVVLRHLIELVKNSGERIIAKHKQVDFQERKHQPKPGISAEKLVVLKQADEIAKEWVTHMRLHHVIDQIKSLENGRELDITDTGKVCQQMVKDVLKESKYEIVNSKEVHIAISRKTALLFKQTFTICHYCPV